MIQVDSELGVNRIVIIVRVRKCRREEVGSAIKKHSSSNKDTNDLNA